MSARQAFARRRALAAAAAASLAVAALGLAGPTVHPAAATPKTSAGKTCERPNGERVQPGDYEVLVVITYNNQGQEVGHERRKLICGEDGEWHRVAEIRVAPGRVKTVQTTVIRTTAKRARTR